MPLKTLITATWMSLATATASFAVPVDFTFSFSNGTNTISGVIEGLERDGADQSATSILVSGVSADFFFSGTDFTSNLFSVSDGVIDPLSVEVFAQVSQVGPTGSAFGFLSIFPSAFGASLSEVLVGPTGLQTPSTFSADIVFSDVPAVAIPASSVMLLAGIGGFALMTRRKRRAASRIAA